MGSLELQMILLGKFYSSFYKFDGDSIQCNKFGSSLFEAMVLTPFFPHPDLLIYLEGSFEQVLDRIQMRGREMEQQTPITYWEEMYARYTEWINNFNLCPVLRLSIEEYDLINDPNSV